MLTHGLGVLLVDLVGRGTQEDVHVGHASDGPVDEGGEGRGGPFLHG